MKNRVPGPALGAALMALVALMATAWVPAWAGAEPAPQETPEESMPVISAVGASIALGRDAASSHWGTPSLQPDVVLRFRSWRLSTASPLASESGERPVSGLAATLPIHDGVRLDAGLSLVRPHRITGDVVGRVLHETPGHVRGRVVLSWKPDPLYQFIVMPATDLSGRGAGSTVDLSLVREWRLALWPYEKLQLATGAGLSWADARSNRSLYGIDAQDAERSGLRPYEPSSGWQQLQLFSNARQQVDHDWVAYASINMGLPLGPALQSPLLAHRWSWGFSLGLGRRL